MYSKMEILTKEDLRTTRNMDRIQVIVGGKEVR